ncbi:MAG: hypothetical protein R6W68_14985 [Ignavibacteriaceae bacterium]
MKAYSMQLLIIAIIFSVLAFFGCEKKTETADDAQETTIESEPAPIEETQEEITEPEEPVVEIPDLKGQWTGIFDKRNTVMEITEQTDSSFSGKLSIKYRETINQEVKGTFSPTTKRVSMTDQIHSKYMGKYSGKLSDDGKNISGTFTSNREGTTSTFNLNKK